MNANTDWNLQSRAAGCHACECTFIDKQICHTLLRFNADGYERIDLCEACFERQPADDDVHSSWKGIFQVPPPPTQRTARKEDVETLLRRLIDEQDPDKRPMIFVLAVILERKRILIERAVHTRPDGLRQSIYEHRKTGETLVVTDPELQIDDLGELEEQVANQLAQTAQPAVEPNPRKDARSTG